MKLTPEQLVENWEQLLKVIENTFSGDRKEKLLKLHNDFEDRLMYMPASYKEYYHSCFPGGYVIHILNVINNSIELDKLWTDRGQTKNYTDEELIFASLMHDFGKVGDINNTFYVESNEAWKKNRGELYSINDDLRNMDIAHRSLWWLNEYEIKFTQTEMIAIRLHDGLYDTANENYLKTFYENKRLRDNLPIILHHADMMSMTIERDKHYESKTTSPTSDKKTKKSNNIKVSKSAQSMWDEFAKKDK